MQKVKKNDVSQANLLDVQALRYQNSGENGQPMVCNKVLCDVKSALSALFTPEDLYPHGFNRQLLPHKQYLTRTRVV